MSPDRTTLLRVAIACGMLGCSTGSVAQDEEPPDIDFLEYLGSWDESDEDWLIVERVDNARREVDGEVRNDADDEVQNDADDDVRNDVEDLERSDPAKDDEESQEKRNES